MIFDVITPEQRQYYFEHGALETGWHSGRGPAAADAGLKAQAYWHMGTFRDRCGGDGRL